MPGAVQRFCIVVLAVAASGCLNDRPRPMSDVDDAGAGTGGAAADGAPARDASAPDRPATDAIGLVDAPAGAETARDMGACAPACAVGERRCGASGGLQTCALDAAGCPSWSDEASCGPNASCAGTAPRADCQCRPAPAGCTEAGNFCGPGGALVTCSRDTRGCLHVSASTACSATQPCKGTLPNAACGCENGCAATQVGSYCADVKTVATCTAVAGCFLSSNRMACPGIRTCQGSTGQAACQCPVAALVVGGGCPTAGLTACAGSAVVTCTTDPGGSGCTLWAATTDCATGPGGPLTCGTRAGSAACQCAEPATDLHVDPIAGSDAMMGVVPTGAAMPPACRFRTLGRALRAAPGAGARVVATTATPPATFSGESFPLVVPAGITVTTAMPGTSAGATIVFASATAGAAVVLGGAGAALEGYTIQAATGNPAAAAVACTTGAVALRNVALAGGGKLTAGIVVGTTATDTCTATVSGSAVDGFGVGVFIQGIAATISGTTIRVSGSDGVRVAGGTVTLGAGTKVEGSGRDGLRVEGGMVTATGLAVTGSAGDGVSIQAGAALLRQTTLSGNAARGLFLGAGSATVEEGSLIKSNGAGGKGSGIRSAGGTLAVGRATGERVEIAENGLEGIRVQAAGPAVATVIRTTLHDNVGFGLLIDLEGASSSVTVSDSELHTNASGGVLVNRAAAASGSALTLDNVNVRDNPGVGVWLRGDLGDIAATLRNSSIRANHDTGVVVEQGSGFITRVTLQGNDVSSNNSSLLRTTGGILFATPSTLTAFTGNRLRGNSGDELGFAARPNGGDTWVLRPASLGCDAATLNQIWCYTTIVGSTSVGIRIMAGTPAGTRVDARNFAWTHPAPMRGRDWDADGLGGFTSGVDTMPACPAVTVGCP